MTDRRLLLVHAHPDDESINNGATMARYVDAGIGVTLVAATLVIPAVVARMLTDSFSRMLWISSLLGASGGFVGMNLSYHLNVPSGTTIVLVDAAIFCLVLMVTGGRGMRRAGGLDEHIDTPLAVTPSKLAGRPGVVR